MDGWLTFCTEFLKHPRQIGSVMPSSRFLERRIVDAAAIRSARTIVELGPGSGGTTRAILNAAPSDARLLCIEANPCLYALVQGIRDERLTVHLGDAGRLQELLALYRLGRPDVVVSGIPFSTMGSDAGSLIVAGIFSALAPGGYFVAYQLSSRVAALCLPFQQEKHVELELFNIPPMRVYRWIKT